MKVQILFLSFLVDWEEDWSYIMDLSNIIYEHVSNYLYFTAG